MNTNFKLYLSLALLAIMATSTNYANIIGSAGNLASDVVQTSGDIAGQTIDTAGDVVDQTVDTADDIITDREYRPGYYNDYDYNLRRNYGNNRVRNGYYYNNYR